MTGDCDSDVQADGGGACIHTIRPATIVAIGAPLNLRRSNGELRELLGEVFTS